MTIKPLWKTILEYFSMSISAILAKIEDPLAERNGTTTETLQRISAYATSALERS